MPNLKRVWSWLAEELPSKSIVHWRLNGLYVSDRGGIMKAMIILVLLFTVSAFAATPFAPPADDAPVGLVTSVKGAVQILRAGQSKPVPAKMADLIGPNDHVITGAGAEATILSCGDSRSARLQPLGEIILTTLAMVVNKGKLLDDRKIAGCRLPSTLALSAASKQQAGLSRLRTGSVVKLRTPVEGVYVSEAHPKFSWEPVEGATKYEVRVQNREEEVLFKTTVTGTSFTYPSDGPPLEPGQKYWWRLIAFGSDGAPSMAGTFFQTLPAAQAKDFKLAEADLKKQVAANPKDTGPRILLAFLYEENGMYDSAWHSYDQLSNELKDNNWIKSRQDAMQQKLGWDPKKPK